MPCVPEWWDGLTLTQGPMVGTFIADHPPLSLFKYRLTYFPDSQEADGKTLEYGPDGSCVRKQPPVPPELRDEGYWINRFIHRYDRIYELWKGVTLRWGKYKNTEMRLRSKEYLKDYVDALVMRHFEEPGVDREIKQVELCISGQAPIGRMDPDALPPVEHVRSTDDIPWEEIKRRPYLSGWRRW